MGQRQLRVNELIKREISETLHTTYKQQSVYITITRVDVAPDLRQARVYFSVIGDDLKMRECTQFLRKNSEQIRRLVGKHVVLKYLPHLQFFPDTTTAEAMYLTDKIDELTQDLDEVNEEE